MHLAQPWLLRGEVGKANTSKRSWHVEKPFESLGLFRRYNNLPAKYQQRLRSRAIERIAPRVFRLCEGQKGELQKRIVRMVLEAAKSKRLWDLYNIKCVIGMILEAHKRSEKACKKQREQIQNEGREVTDREVYQRACDELAKEIEGQGRER
jgi:hypothetical protein